MEEKPCHTLDTRFLMAHRAKDIPLIFIPEALILIQPVACIFSSTKKNCLGRSSEVPCDPILIGETDDLSELDENCECLNEHGADLLCVLVENNEDQRRKIYDDISEEYQDVPCE